jgi:hypothetical protein
MPIACSATECGAALALRLALKDRAHVHILKRLARPAGWEVTVRELALRMRCLKCRAAGHGEYPC